MNEKTEQRINSSIALGATGIADVIIDTHNTAIDECIEWLKAATLNSNSLFASKLLQLKYHE